MNFINTVYYLLNETLQTSFVFLIFWVDFEHARHVAPRAIKWWPGLLFHRGRWQNVKIKFVLFSFPIVRNIYTYSHKRGYYYIEYLKQ